MNTGKKKKILFLMPSMAEGGAQRVTTNLLKYLDRKRFILLLALAKKEGLFLEYVPNDVKIIDLKCRHLRNAAWNIIRLIWRLKPNVVFSLHMDMNSLVSVLRLILPRKIRFVVRPSNIPTLFNKNSRYECIQPLIYRILYKRFDAIICQSEDIKEDLQNYYRLSDYKMSVIHNPIDFSYLKKNISGKRKCLPEGKINIVAAGKLEHQKGFDLLLNAFAKISDQKFHLTILGKGSQRNSLMQLARRLNISKRVTFAGFQSNPHEYMAQADLFVLSSRFEGLPNVVLEANYCGTPAVAFECPGGINEIIEDGVNGWKVKVNDCNAMATTIEKASRIRWNSKRIKEYISFNFSLKEIIAEYEEVLLGFEDAKAKNSYDRISGIYSNECNIKAMK